MCKHTGRCEHRQRPEPDRRHPVRLHRRRIRVRENRPHDRDHPPKHDDVRPTSLSGRISYQLSARGVHQTDAGRGRARSLYTRTGRESFGPSLCAPCPLVALGASKKRRGEETRSPKGGLKALRPTTPRLADRTRGNRGMQPAPFGGGFPKGCLWRRSRLDNG